LTCSEGRYRRNPEKPEAITPDAILEYAFSLHTQELRVSEGTPADGTGCRAPGSRFIDRNPQTSVPNIFDAPSLGLPEGDASRVSFGAVPVARRDPGGGAAVTGSGIENQQSIRNHQSIINHHYQQSPIS